MCCLYSYVVVDDIVGIVIKGGSEVGGYCLFDDFYSLFGKVVVG